MLRHVLLQVTRLRQSEQLSFEGGKPLPRHAGLCRRRQFLPGGTLRRISSKKLKMKLTLLTALASPATESFSTAESFSTTKRLPSGCTSKFEAGPRLVNWPGDQSCGLSAWKESPEAV